MVDHGLKMMQVYNQIAKFVTQNKDLLQSRLVFVAYSQNAIPIYLNEDTSLFQDLIEGEMKAKLKE